jgi:hypothetical protein
MLWKLNFITIWVLNSIIEFWAEDKHKTDLRKQSLIDQEWHLTLDVPTSEPLHAGRERERTHLQNNNKAKSEQLKLSKTYQSTWP